MNTILGSRNFDHRSNIIDVDKMEHRLLPGIEELHLGYEVPDFEIKPESTEKFRVDGLAAYLRRFC